MKRSAARPWLRHVRTGVCLLGLLTAACDPVSGPTASDFAVLARAEPGYEEARPGRHLSFPADHGAHPGYRIEWWYLTANLRDAEGRPYGVQWTLFRSALRPPDAPADTNPWLDSQIYMAHFAVTTPDGHAAFQRYARGGLHSGLPRDSGGSGPTRAEARAGVRSAPLAAWLDDWSIEADPEFSAAGSTASRFTLHARDGHHAARLRLTRTGPVTPQGDAGFSRKHPSGGGSHYYSLPFLRAEGELVADGRRIAVSGDAWMDHEWSSQFLQPDQDGWDWFALHLESGEKLTMFRVRGSGETPGSDQIHAVLLAPNAKPRPLDPTRLALRERRRTEVAGHQLPLSWTLDLPEIDRRLNVEALHPRQWMDLDFKYWEGVVRVTGASAAERGVGYMELTGYPAH